MYVRIAHCAMQITNVANCKATIGFKVMLVVVIMAHQMGCDCYERKEAPVARTDKCKGCCPKR